MKDAKGHGSDAHQSGVMRALNRRPEMAQAKAQADYKQAHADHMVVRKAYHARGATDQQFLSSRARMEGALKALDHAERRTKSFNSVPQPTPRPRRPRQLGLFR